MNLSTGYPYGLINSGLPFSYPKLDKAIHTDVVIIGGGISGALTAYYLINAGIDCIVVDARTIGLGSTCASTSLLQYELDTPLTELTKQIGWDAAMRSYKLCSKSIDTLQRIADKINFKHFQQQESLFFGTEKKDINFLEAECKLRLKAGFDVQLLSNKDVQKQFGFSATSAILSAQGASTDAYLLTHALLQYSVSRGLLVYDRTEITKIAYQKRSVKLYTENGISISAKKIVNAAGYEITEFIEKKVVMLNATYAIASEHLPPNVIPWKQRALLWNTEDPYLYMRMTDDNRIILGGRDEAFYNPERRDKLIKRKTTFLKRDFEKLFPGIPFIPEFSWTGTFGSTMDSLPYIGPYVKTPHTYYALGFGGNGITFSVIAAEIIRDYMIGKVNRNQSLFSFER